VTHGDETIFALASGKGRAGLSVIRLSGPAVKAALRALAGHVPPPRTAILCTFSAPTGAAGPPLLLDRGLVLFFPHPRSFTGEDVGELHVHGSPAVIDSVFQALSALGLRPAGPGEFTRRAFDHGKMDLTEVEALADLIAAETEEQRAQALRQMHGGLATLYEAWRARVLEALAWVEAQIDFSEEDLPRDMMEHVQETVRALARDMAVHLADGQRGERVRDGVSVVILGPPNVGKSSLLNALARRDVAIVAAQSGTTRDIIEVHLDLGGVAVCVADTAGLRDAASEIEQEGMRRARVRADAADLRIHLTSSDCPRSRARPSAQARPVACAAHDLHVVNKADLMPRAPGNADHFGAGALWISVKTGEGMETFIRALTRAVAALTKGGESVVLTRARHRHAVQDALRALNRFLEAPAQDVGLLAEELRLALRALARLTGRADVEDVLDVIFSEFCIGK